ncbi:MAG: hypothetical protein ABSG51_03030 [Terracidiphilus sp.]
MPALMSEVVLNQKLKGHGLIFADDTQRREAFFGDAIHNGSENLVLGLLPADQRIPGLAGVAVRGDPGILGILRAGIVTVNGRADKALAVVGGRVEQVPDNLLTGPSAGAPWGVGKCGGKGEKRGAQGA